MGSGRGAGEEREERAGNAIGGEREEGGEKGSEAKATGGKRKNKRRGKGHDERRQKAGDERTGRKGEAKDGD